MCLIVAKLRILRLVQFLSLGRLALNRWDCLASSAAAVLANLVVVQPSCLEDLLTLTKAYLYIKIDALFIGEVSQNHLTSWQD